MSPEEIQEIPADARTAVQWLREIAYQLAVSNERKMWARPDEPAATKKPPAVQPGKPIYQRAKQ